MTSFLLTDIATLVACALVAICTAYTAAALVSLWRATGREDEDLPVRRGGDVPPVSVLKPLCGADDALEANLETFFNQTYPRYELVFGVEGDRDPAISVVRSLRARYPNVACRLVIHDGGRALNPKVSNLVRTLESGSHDIVVISDSNVSAPADYIARMVAQLERPGTGMVTSLFAGVDEQTLGATLDNLHLNGHCAPAVAFSQEFQSATAVVGKSMMFRRSVFESLGGFDSVGAVLAEDFVMGRMLHAAGYDVVIDRRIVHNVNRSTTVRGFLRRHLRWGLLRSRLMPLTYLAEPLSNPIFVGAVGTLLVGSAWPLTWALAATLVRDAASWLRLRGSAGLMRALPLGPLKDAALIAVWAAAPLLKRITWRHNRVRVGAGTRLYAERPMPEAQVLLTEE